MLISLKCVTMEMLISLKKKHLCVDFTSTGKLRDVDFTLKKYTYMLISPQKATSKTLFPLKKQLNVDFTGMRDHRDAHFI